MAWIFTVGISLLYNVNPVQDILFLLGIVLIMSGSIIKFHNITLGGIGLLIFTIYTYYVPDLNFLLVNVSWNYFWNVNSRICLFIFKRRMNKEIEKLLFNPIRLKTISFLMTVETCNFKVLT